MICQHCHGVIKETEGVCHLCGNSPASFNGEEAAIREMRKHSKAAIPLIGILICLIPSILCHIILTFLFSDEQDKLIIGLIITLSVSVIAVVIFGIILQVQHYKKLHQHGVKVTIGKIVGTSIQPGIRMRYYPIVEFKVNGKDYRYIFDRDTSDEGKKGATVDIAYHTRNPHDCFLAKDYRGLAIIAATLVAVCSIGGFALVIYLTTR